MTRRKKRSGPAAIGAAKKNHLPIPTSAKPTPAGPPGEVRFTRMADWALLTGEPAFDGDMVAIPDVAAAQAFANGLGELPPALVAQRPDGRTVHFYQIPDGWAA